MEVKAGNCRALILFILAVLLFLPGLLSAGQADLFTQPGRIDLTSYDLEAAPILSLSGPWLFAPDYDKSLFQSMDVPGSWSLSDLPEQGCGTYSLRIILPPGAPETAFLFGNIFTASRIRVNGKTYLENGIPGTSSDNTIPGWSPVLLRIAPPSDGILDLEIDVANFNHAKGGITNRVEFGEARVMQWFWEMYHFMEILSMGFLLWMGVYHFIFSIFRKVSVPVSVSFALACLLFAFRMVFIGNFQISSFLPAQVWEPFLRIEYLLYLIATYFFIRFLALMFREDFYQPLVKVYFGISLIYLLLVLVSPTLFFTSLLPIHQLTLMISFFLTVGYLIQAVKHKREGAGLILSGMIILFITGLNDVLMYKVRTSFSNITIPGAVIFMILDSFVLCRSFSRKFSETEALSSRLSIANDALNHSRREVHKKNSELQVLASSDHLTGLPNRMALFELVDKELARAGRSGQKVGVILVDLDSFKQINDNYGHDRGDQVLCEFASRVSRILRKGDSVFRLGGDEFTVIVPDLTEPESLVTVAEKILGTLSFPIELEGFHCQMSTSMGISQFPDDGDSVHSLLKHADIALYEAKNQGRNRFVWFDRAMQKLAEDKFRLIRRMPDALQAGEFLLYFQPQMNMKDYSLYGLEVLIRWKDSESGFLSPGLFIPLMEETGFIHILGEWIMDKAFTTALPWVETNPELLISINISSVQFNSREFLEILDFNLIKTGFPGKNLVLELTEGVIMNDNRETLRKLDGIKRRGIRISVDDFGTGYSSLGYLKKFPLDHLKIDQSFIRDLFLTDFDKEIVSTIIDLAAILGLEVIAEGIEMPEQQAFLESRGCYIMQGFLMGRPVPPETITDLLSDSEKVKLFLQML